MRTAFYYWCGCYYDSLHPINPPPNMSEEAPDNGAGAPHAAVPPAVGARNRSLSPASDVTRTPIRRPGDVGRITQQHQYQHGQQR